MHMIMVQCIDFEIFLRLRDSTLALLKKTQESRPPGDFAPENSNLRNMSSLKSVDMNIGMFITLSCAR